MHDVTAFKSNGIVDGLVNNVAAANISESEKTPDPVKALVWHGASLLLVGTEQGERRTSLSGQWWFFLHVVCRMLCINMVADRVHSADDASLTSFLLALLGAWCTPQTSHLSPATHILLVKTPAAILVAKQPLCFHVTCRPGFWVC